LVGSTSFAVHNTEGAGALARLNRDVLTQSGVLYLIELEGVNDLGRLTRDGPVTDAAHSELVNQIIESYAQIITRANTRGLKVIGGTIMPFAGSNYYHPGPATEADRQSVNAWIRTSGHFDAVVDFDRVMADAAHPAQLPPDYDCGDHLHPSPTGYAAMANAIPLGLFGK
jgi:lysophospholipase L1-like esterase